MIALFTSFRIQGTDTFYAQCIDEETESQAAKVYGPHAMVGARIPQCCGEGF